MKKKIRNRISKGIGMLATVVCLGIMIAPVSVCTVQAAEMSAEQETVASARFVAYEWRYMTVDGQRYKRLWDPVKQIWLTDWIPCD